MSITITTHEHVPPVVIVLVGVLDLRRHAPCPLGDSIHPAGAKRLSRCPPGAAYTRLSSSNPDACRSRSRRTSTCRRS
jgi:hypothetical protein